jgi:hypothetical protein
LKEFNAHLAQSMSRLHGQFNRLGDTWRDQEQQRYAQEFEQTMRMLQQFSRSSEQQIPVLLKKAQHLRAYLNQR